MNLINSTLDRIQEVTTGKRPAIMASFGKDSMVLIALTRILQKDLPVIYHRFHWFPEKNRFADEITQKWNLQVFDWLPQEMGVQTNEKTIEPVASYQHGPATRINISPVTMEPVDDKPYLCGRYDILERPRGSLDNNPWDLLLLGQKASDVDVFSGPNILKTDFVEKSEDGAPDLCYPMKDWTDNDVWQFISDYKVPYQTDRYSLTARAVLEDKTYNNDYIHACMRCLDNRQPKEVMCPKLNRLIPNVSNRVKDLGFKAPYIEYAQ